MDGGRRTWPSRVQSCRDDRADWLEPEPPGRRVRRPPPAARQQPECDEGAGAAAGERETRGSDRPPGPPARSAPPVGDGVPDGGDLPRVKGRPPRWRGRRPGPARARPARGRVWVRSSGGSGRWVAGAAGATRMTWSACRTALACQPVASGRSSGRRRPEHHAVVVPLRTLQAVRRRPGRGPRRAVLWRRPVDQDVGRPAVSWGAVARGRPPRQLRASASRPTVGDCRVGQLVSEHPATARSAAGSPLDGVLERRPGHTRSRWPSRAGPGPEAERTPAGQQGELAEHGPGRRAVATAAPSDDDVQPTGLDDVERPGRGRRLAEQATRPRGSSNLHRPPSSSSGA